MVVFYFKTIKNIHKIDETSLLDTIDQNSAELGLEIYCFVLTWETKENIN